MAPFRLLKKTLARRRRVCLSLSGISMHQSTARGNTGRGRPGGRVLVRVRVITLAFSVLRRPLTPAAAELKGLHDEPCHRQEHLESQRQRSRRLWRRRARAREHASTREGSRWAPCGPASPSGLPSRPEAPRRGLLWGAFDPAGARSATCPPRECGAARPTASRAPARLSRRGMRGTACLIAAGLSGKTKSRPLAHARHAWSWLRARRAYAGRLQLQH